MPTSAQVIALGAMALSGTVFLTATTGMIIHMEPFHTWYYLFCWWTYIVFSEGLLRLKKGRSELFDDPGRFWMTLPLSLLFWLVFEVLNFRVQNWHYSGVPPERWLRWTGYAISFATVLPGLNVTRNLLDRFTTFGKARDRDGLRLQGLHPAMIAVGASCLILPLIAPQFFFPFIWLAFIFLFEPLNYRLGAPSLLRDLEDGFYGRVFQLPVAGLCCGLLWETWNFWAGAKWTYTIPFLGFLKVFEMPVLGFLGFLPFAIEAHVLSSTAWVAIQAVGRQRSRPRRTAIWTILLLCFILFVCFVFEGIDRMTVAGYRS